MKSSSATRRRRLPRRPSSSTQPWCAHMASMPPIVRAISGVATKCFSKCWMTKTKCSRSSQRIRACLAACPNHLHSQRQRTSAWLPDSPPERRVCLVHSRTSSNRKTGGTRRRSRHLWMGRCAASARMVRPMMRWSWRSWSLMTRPSCLTPRASTMASKTFSSRSVARSGMPSSPRCSQRGCHSARGIRRQRCWRSTSLRMRSEEEIV
mmetsp:Transcript_35263/g.92545  ORF Transcript_35263/g.92545 Transcript_35263/m.92545 type:complete len:208 (-) Transcript_35263:103-726(-)